MRPKKAELIQAVKQRQGITLLITVQEIIPMLKILATVQQANQIMIHQREAVLLPEHRARLAVHMSGELQDRIHLTVQGLLAMHLQEAMYIRGLHMIL